MSFLNISSIEIRIKTRLINSIHTILNNGTPYYLTDLLYCKPNIRSLKNPNNDLLTIPEIYRKQHGERSFRYSAAIIWTTYFTEKEEILYFE